MQQVAPLRAVCQRQILIGNAKIYTKMIIGISHHETNLKRDKNKCVLLKTCQTANDKIMTTNNQNKTKRKNNRDLNSTTNKINFKRGSKANVFALLKI